jgi:DNA-binding GntR family transcriptional regulator
MARVHLEAQMNAARDARAFLDAVMTLHRTLVTAARVQVLDAMHQSASTRVWWRPSPVVTGPRSARSCC